MSRRPGDGAGRTAVACLLIGLAAVVGCDAPAPDRAAELPSRIEALKEPARPVGPESPEFDAGPVLAGDRQIHHRFRLLNPGDRPVRLLGGEAVRPCCSAIGPVPSILPAGGAVEVPVVMRTGSDTGPRRVEFRLTTDVPGARTWVLGLRADLLAEFEVQEEGDEHLLTGEAGERLLRITCRRQGEEGKGPLDGVELGPSLEGALRGAPTQAPEPRLDGVLVSRQEVAIRLPAGTMPGPRREEIVYHWADGTSRRGLVQWDVAPRLRVSPSGLVVRASDGPSLHSFVLSSADLPFRVVAAGGPSLVGPAESLDEPRRSHAVRLRIDPGRARPGAAHEVRIETDHPHEREVSISVLVTPEE